MTMTRRTFLLTSGVMVAAPILADALPRDLRERIDHLAATTDGLTLRMDGWDSGTDDPNAVWLAVGRSWRSDWR